MAWSWPLVRLFGSEVRVHATFLLLLAFVALSGWQAGGAAAAAANVLFVLALFACVVAHEFGHALMARRYGIATPDITLLPIGGLARLERMPEAPAREIAVALAGPAVSFGLWLVLALLAGTLTDPGLPDGGSFVADLAAINLMLAVFNLLPAFPMDGGRVLRAALSARWGPAKATAVAARAGQAMAVLFVVVGLAGGQVLLALIGVFIWIAAASEQGEARLRGALAGLTARDAMITAFEPLAPEDTLQAAAAALIRTTQHEFPVLDPAARPVGFLTRQALFRAMAEGERTAHVAELMTRDIPAVPLTRPLPEVMALLGADGAPAVAVCDRAGRMIGYVTIETLGELTMLRGRESDLA